MICEGNGNYAAWDGDGALRVGTHTIALWFWYVAQEGVIGKVNDKIILNKIWHA